MEKCCPKSDFNPGEVDPGKCDRKHCTCLDTPTREHDDECDCQACLKVGMAYLREQVETLRDKLYQRDLKVTQLCECINALTGFDLNGDG